jgi:hypothetical protein
MINSEETVARLLPEQPDGTRLVVQEGDGEYKVIWRDDTAAGMGTLLDERWFGPGTDDDPMAFYEHVKYAVAVYSVGPLLIDFKEPPTDPGGPTITLKLIEQGERTATVVRADYEAAKQADELTDFLDPYASNIGSDWWLIEPDGTKIVPVY